MKHIKYLLLNILFFVGLFFSFANATEEPEPPIQESPTVSPDGKKIAFVSGLEGNDLWLINIDGTGLRKITSGFSVWDPKWAPNSSKIAFSSNKEGDLDIWVIDTLTLSLTRLTNDSDREDEPAWSPDGARIVYSNDQGDIIIMNSDGTGTQKIGSLLGGSPAWSPDGSKIVFHRNYTPNFWNLWIINVDGTDLTQLTSGEYIDWNPVWSPDGSKIAFSSNRADHYSTNIWAINPDGSGLQRMTSDDASTPCWLPDGTGFVYSRFDEASNIWITDKYGTSQRQITRIVAYSLPFSQFDLKHWSINWNHGKRDKNKFQLSGRIDLPDNYTLDMLQKKGSITISIEEKNSMQFSQNAIIDFKQKGTIWRYKGSKGKLNLKQSLDIEKMIIFWQPEISQDKSVKAGKSHHKRSGWFMIQGNINEPVIDQAMLLPKASLTVNIPLENIVTVGNLESTFSIDFTIKKDLWLFQSAQPYSNWKDSWWDEIKDED